MFYGPGQILRGKVGLSNGDIGVRKHGQALRILYVYVAQYAQCFRCLPSAAQLGLHQCEQSVDSDAGDTPGVPAELLLGKLIMALREVGEAEPQYGGKVIRLGFKHRLEGCLGCRELSLTVLHHAAQLAHHGMVSRQLECGIDVLVGFIQLVVLDTDDGPAEQGIHIAAFVLERIRVSRVSLGQTPLRAFEIPEQRPGLTVFLIQLYGLAQLRPCRVELASHRRAARQSPIGRDVLRVLVEGLRE